MSRYKARQRALQILFSREFHAENDIQFTEEEILEADNADTENVDISEISDHDDENEYCNYLVETTREHMEDIDTIISSYAKGWTISQMDRADKNVLRMALCELNYPKEKLEVSIILNEAVRLAKRYGGPASSKFVNGILGAYVKARS